MDLHGWVDAEKHKPPKCLFFELLIIQDDEGRQQQGWWTGQEWDYCPKKINGNVSKWRFLKCVERLGSSIDYNRGW